MGATGSGRPAWWWVRSKRRAVAARRTLCYTRAALASATYCARMPALPEGRAMQLRHAASTDVGRARDHNEDTFVIEAGADQAERGALFVVCDGMGGFAAGEVASELAAETITGEYRAAAGANPGEALRAAFIEANTRIF